MAIARTR